MRLSVLFIVAGLLAVGCSSRTLTINSEPTGAAVRVNGERVEGATPVTVPAPHDGVYRIELERNGYRRKVAQFATHPEWYERYPADVFTDFLNPTMHDESFEVTVELEPIDPGGEPRVVDDAEVQALINDADRARATGGQ
jgi:hypothetical protein